ncbi:glycosyltransferase family 4 protein [Flexibacterium corallicola]|uniref:glycosyltransferase family 4 protein n=1 Tax=Flexibacterium corallicola TaxID=3037259 RepID=UPI00286F7463|nr:glycosyltransferase family 1 protein [Pseudovibrio sp. M1P-2-3]
MKTAPDLYYDLSEIKDISPKMKEATGLTRSLLEVGKALYNSNLKVAFICFDNKTGLHSKVDAKLFFQCPTLIEKQQILGKREKVRSLQKEGLSFFRRSFRQLKNQSDLVILSLAPPAKGLIHHEDADLTLAPVLSLGSVKTLSRFLHCFTNPSKDIEVFGMIHDLSPLRMGDQDKSCHLDWKDYLDNILKSPIKLLSNSQFTARDVIAYAKQNRLPNPTNISTCHLAHEFSIESKASLLSRGQTKPYFLMVGDVWGRKNGKLVFKALDYLKKHYPDIPVPHLVCAGQFCKNTLEKLTEEIIDKEVLATTTFVQAPSQSELKKLYENAELLIYPSLYEGYGLPVGEALWHGTPVMASNATSIPEVADNYVTYFDPEIPEELAELLVNYTLNPHPYKDRVPPRSKLRTWEKVTFEIWDTISKHSKYHHLNEENNKSKSTLTV